ncbi:cell wall hydrolase [Tabrizicola oligotrophica]|uniref:Cell wall hydrolase n=1 Tax=Tabrizicola oligotrophica TaxID=2710650 RepID=A0A6M0QT95_9RHOB|nr:cell wall hydrolase [Tabrizicola oligotrophica]NEY90685.1 cell wall hydrolase [Tabrizicola oligotrophica]
MRLHQIWTAAILALGVHSGAAFAEVTVSQSNDPTLKIGQQFASLLDAEHKALGALPEARRTAIAMGAMPKPAADKAARKTKAKGKADAPVEISYSHAFLAGLGAPAGDEQWQCLTKALYFEARGESLKGQFAVAEVILNRVDSPKYPATVCGVVEQGGQGGCQFSYTCDGARDVMADRQAADIAGRIARVMLDGAPRTLTYGATHFHTRAVTPAWSRRFERTASIGAHMFYKP